MEKPLGESQACNNGEASTNSSQRMNYEEVPYPLLDLPLTKNPELMSLIESVLKEQYQEKPPTLTSHQTPRRPEKERALKIQFSKITIGQWTHVSKNQDDLTAKFYFKKKKLLWEILFRKEDTHEPHSLKRKIEMDWADVSSLKSSDLHDGTEVLEIELSKRPTFFKELPPLSLKASQWKQMDHDFTLNNFASTCRRHILYFARGDLKKFLEKLASNNSFWSKLSFPNFQTPYFDLAFANNNNNDGNYPTRSNYNKTLSDLHFNPNNNNNGNNPTHYYPDHYIQNPTCSSNVNNSDLHHQSQGFGHMGVGEGNFSMVTQFGANPGWQINPFSQTNIVNNNTSSQLFAMQAIQPPPSQQLTNEYYTGGGSFIGSDICNLVSQGMNQLPQAVLETQTNSTLFQNMNDLATSPQIGPYATDIILRHEEERQNHDQSFAEFIDQLFGNDDGSLPPGF